MNHFSGNTVKEKKKFSVLSRKVQNPLTYYDWKDILYYISPTKRTSIQQRLILKGGANAKQQTVRKAA